jgi:hypothetical protein
MRIPVNTFALEPDTSNGEPSLAYTRVTIRVPQPLALQVREVGEFSGWQLADLQRTLLCLGATFFLLSYLNAFDLQN